MSTIENERSNPFLEGNLAPVSEEVTVFDLEVTGTLPPELDGRYLRNGPNPIGDVNRAKYHWFTGHGMVHGVPSFHTVVRWTRTTQIIGSGRVAPHSRLVLCTEINACAT